MNASGSHDCEHLSERGRVRLNLLIPAAIVVTIGLALLVGTRRPRAADRFVAQLHARGEKVTFAELTGGDSVISNPAPEVVATVAQTLQSISYSPSELYRWAYTRPGWMRVAWKEAAVPTRPGGKPVTWQDLAHYLEQAQEPLTALRAILETAPPGWGRRTNYFQKTPSSVASIVCALWLSAAALHDLHANQLEPALRNLEALGDLARTDTLDYVPVTEFIRGCVARIGLEVTWHAWQAEGWSEQQLQRLQRVWEGVDLLRAGERGLIGERAEAIDLWEQTRRWNGKGFRRLMHSPATDGFWQSALFDWVVWPAYKTTSMNADELFFLQTTQAAIDEVREVRARRSWDRAKSSAAFAAKWSQITRTPARYRISSLTLPKCTEILESAVRTETFRQLTLTAMAIKRYRLEQQELPPHLAALTPEYLSTPPYDPMSGGALPYQVSAAGDFLLYSVGEDLQDNCGDPGQAIPGSRVGLWEGRDAVWPKAE